MVRIKTFTLVTPLIVIALGGFTSPKQVIRPPIIPNIFDTAIYGPFSSSPGKTNVIFYFTNNSINDYNLVQETAKIYRGGTETLLHTNTTKEHAVAKGQTYKGAIVFDTTYFERYKKLDLELIVTNNNLGDTTTLFQQRHTVYRFTSPTLNAQDYVTTPYTHDQTTLAFSTLVTKTSFESIKFTSFPTVIGSEIYYTLSLDNFYIDYMSSSPFVYDEAYLSFFDFKRYFSYYNVSKTEVRIPIDLYEENKRIYLRPRKAFVDKTTMTMSPTSRPGYVLTDKFYMPLKGREDMDGLNMTLTIVNAGTNKATFTSPVTYYASKNLFGDSSNSEYYIRGGVMDD